MKCIRGVEDRSTYDGDALGSSKGDGESSAPSTASSNRRLARSLLDVPEGPDELESMRARAMLPTECISVLMLMPREGGIPRAGLAQSKTSCHLRPTLSTALDT